MITRTEIEQMSRSEKLQAMETIWAELSKDEAECESPAWHENALKETEARLAAGKEQTIDWTAAKQQLRERSE